MLSNYKKNGGRRKKKESHKTVFYFKVEKYLYAINGNDTNGSEAC